MAEFDRETDCITKRQLLEELEKIPLDGEIYFNLGDITFHTVKSYGNNLWQIQFNEEVKVLS